MSLGCEQIRQGACYSNGEFGKKWLVWQVAEILSETDSVRFRILVGKNRRKYRTLLLTEFSIKMRYEVTLVESTWQRVDKP